MRLVEVMEGPEGDSLPLEYDPEKIADYWGRRPVAVTTRILQLLSEWRRGEWLQLQWLGALTWVEQGMQGLASLQPCYMDELREPSITG